MDNLDKLIQDLTNILDKKFENILYAFTNNLSTKIQEREIIDNYTCFLSKNNIEVLEPLRQRASGENQSEFGKIKFLEDLINKDQHRIKNKIIFRESRMFCWEFPARYCLTTIENAKKLVIFGSFEY